MGWLGWRSACVHSIPIAGLGRLPYAPGPSGNVVTEDLVFLLKSMGFITGIEIPALRQSRKVLHARLPAGATARPGAQSRTTADIPKGGLIRQPLRV